MIRLDVLIARRDFFEDALPEAVAVSQHIRFVAHGHALAARRPRIIESGSDDALDTFARVDLFLNGNLVRRAFLKVAAHEGVQAFGIFSKDDKINILFAAVFQRTQPRVNQFDRAQVDVEVEAGAHAEQYISGMSVVFDARVAERAGEYRIVLRS